MGLPFHPLWLILILAIVLIIFGPGKLPELGGAVGRGIREFRKAQNDITNEVRASMDQPTTPAPTPTTAAPAAEPKAEAEKTS
jgi:sec-independent protein translocase protein TatA